MTYFLRVDGWLVRWPSYAEWILKGRLVSPGKPTNEKLSIGHWTCGA